MGLVTRIACFIGVCAIFTAFTGCSRQDASATAAAANVHTTTLHFKVGGMHCSSCENAIKAKLVKLDGVKSCEASHTDGTVALTTTNPAIAPQAIESMTALGYTAERAED